MTPEQWQLILGLVVLPGGNPRPRPTTEELLSAFGAENGPDLCRSLLIHAVGDRSSEDVEGALILSGTLGLDRASLPLLQDLVRQTWHTQHEGILEELLRLGGDDAVVDLEFLAWAGPEFQNYEGSTSLAKKAVHGLERIATPAAREALGRLGDHPEKDVRDLVERVQMRMKG